MKEISAFHARRMVRCIKDSLTLVLLIVLHGLDFDGTHNGSKIIMLIKNITYDRRRAGRFKFCMQGKVLCILDGNVEF